MDRHLTVVVVIVFLGIALLLESLLGISVALVSMAQDGLFVGLSATLVGFLITGITILVTFSDRPAFDEISTTRAYRYVHNSFIYAIWLQIVVLIYSLALKVVFACEFNVRAITGKVYFYVIVVALALLLVCIYYLSLLVTVIVNQKSTEQ